MDQNSAELSVASPIPSIYYSNNGSRYTGMCAQTGIPIIAPTASRTYMYVCMYTESLSLEQRERKRRHFCI